MASVRQSVRSSVHPSLPTFTHTALGHNLVRTSFGTLYNTRIPCSVTLDSSYTVIRVLKLAAIISGVWKVVATSNVGQSRQQAAAWSVLRCASTASPAAGREIRRDTGGRAGVCTLHTRLRPWNEDATTSTRSTSEAAAANDRLRSRRRSRFFVIRRMSASGLIILCRRRRRFLKSGKFVALSVQEFKLQFLQYRKQAIHSDSGYYRLSAGSRPDSRIANWIPSIILHADNNRHESFLAFWLHELHFKTTFTRNCEISKLYWLINAREIYF